MTDPDGPPMDIAVRHDDVRRDGVPRLGALGHALIARQLEEQITARFPVGRRLRVLDVALRHGRQALTLARAGHEVTGLESDPELADAVRRVLGEEPAGIRERMRVVSGDSRSTGAHFLPGSFDVVLCHGVLVPGDEPGPLLAGLGRVLAPGGLLSLLVPNIEAAAMRPGLAGDWTAALARLVPPDPADRALRREALTATLAGMSTPVHRWYGVRVFTGGTDDPALPPGEAGERLLAAEERAGRTDPYRAVAELLHLCAVRG
ncbi:bifunctional 2-polyprenyl-6-hydroxyphenol methylase/3-demethylubiquinol 3-O-methyltransferase UbiG [Streptomyces sp. DH37]|uniref:class I SAM-dependent methyltransferase n=1 Tax=Streptomyces sp. DH37 TaxID=3040122 RepID=UPI0024435EA1|nr:methyltransferase domain-containing protein [Streptomyces sp. DH37]MDG9705046.1 methyltransferase domain-containing protein [Streptomyces sp. DH37]